MSSRMSTRKRNSAIVPDKSVNVKWGEDGAKMSNNKPDIICVTLEEEDDVLDSVNSLIETLDDKRIKKENQKMSLKDLMKLSLSQEVEKATNLFKVQTRMQDSKIKSLSDDLKVNQAEIDIWQNQFRQESQKNVELSKELEEISREKHDFKTQLGNYAELVRELEETKIYFEVAKDELGRMKSESEQEKTRWEQEISAKEKIIETTSREKHDFKTQLEHLSQNYAKLEQKLKSESEKEKGRWEEQMMVKEAMIERLASELGKQSEKIDICQEQLRVVSSEKEDVVKELSLSKWDQDVSQEKFESKNLDAEKSLEKLCSELNLKKQELVEAKELAENRQKLLSDLENVQKEDDKRMKTIVEIVKRITDDKYRIENEHKTCKEERESLEQKMSTQEILGQNQLNVIEMLRRDLKTLEASQSESLDPIKKDLETKSEEVKSQSKVIADQENKIKRFIENEGWFNLITEEQSQKSKVRIKEAESRVSACQAQIKLVISEKKELSKKIENFEEKVASLQKRYDETYAQHFETILSKEKLTEGKESEIIELKKRVEDLKMELELTEMNSETNDDLKQKTAENCDLKSKLENLTEKVKVTEAQLESSLKVNLELHLKFKEISTKVEISENELKLKKSSSVENFDLTLENLVKTNLELESKLEEIRKKVKISENELETMSRKNLHLHLSKKAIEMLEKQVKEKVENIKKLTEAVRISKDDLKEKVKMIDMLEEQVKKKVEEPESEKSYKDQLKAVSEKLSLLEKEKVENMKECERSCKDELKEKVMFLEAEISDQSKDIIWYRTQAKSFNKANQDLQKKLIELEENLKPNEADSKDDWEVTIIDMDLISDEEGELEGDDKVEVADDNSDKPSTSKQTGGQANQVGSDKNSSSKRSRSQTPVEQASKYRRVELKEKSTDEPIFGEFPHLVTLNKYYT